MARKTTTTTVVTDADEAELIVDSETEETDAPPEASAPAQKVAQKRTGSGASVAAEETDDETTTEEGAHADADADAEDDEGYVEEIDYAELVALRKSAKEQVRLAAQLADLKKQLRDTSTKVQGFEREKLSEQERRDLLLKDATDKATTLEAALRQARLMNAITLAAGKLDLDAVLALKLAGADVTFDDEGLPQNVEPLLRALLQEHPQLAQPKTVRSAMNGEKVGGRGKKTITRDDIGAMTEDEINNNWDAVQGLLAQAA